MATANLGAVLTLDDRASAGLVNVARRTESAGQAFRRAVPSLATFGSSMASLLITTGALNSETGRYVTIALSMSSAIASGLPALLALNRALQANAAITAVLRSLHLGPAAIPLIGGALLAGGTVFASTQFGRSSGQPVNVNVDARGSTIRSDEDLRQLADRIGRRLPVR